MPSGSDDVVPSKEATSRLVVLTNAAVGGVFAGGGGAVTLTGPAARRHALRRAAGYEELLR